MRAPHSAPCECQVESGEGAWNEAHEWPCPKADPPQQSAPSNDSTPPEYTSPPDKDIGICDSCGSEEGTRVRGWVPAGHGWHCGVCRGVGADR